MTKLEALTASIRANLQRIVSHKDYAGKTDLFRYAGIFRDKLTASTLSVGDQLLVEEEMNRQIAEIVSKS